MSVERRTVFATVANFIHLRDPQERKSAAVISHLRNRWSGISRLDQLKDVVKGTCIKVEQRSAVDRTNYVEFVSARKKRCGTCPFVAEGCPITGPIYNDRYALKE